MKEMNARLLENCRDEDALQAAYRERLAEFGVRIVKALDDAGIELSAIQIEGPTCKGRDRMGNSPFRQQLVITVSSLPHDDGKPEGWI